LDLAKEFLQLFMPQQVGYLQLMQYLQLLIIDCLQPFVVHKFPVLLCLLIPQLIFEVVLFSLQLSIC
jgi:hypothetical protein